MKNTLISNKDYLEKILPHNQPMILIDNVIDYSIEDKWLKAFVTIKENSLFFDKSQQAVPSIIGIEYMAQTIGCYAYLKNNKINNIKEPKIGYLLGTRLYNNKLNSFELGKTYFIRVKEEYFADDISSFECVIYDNIECKNENEIASSTINVYQNQDDKKGIQNE